MSNRLRKVSLKDCLSEIIDHRGKTPKKLDADWSESGYRAISANNVKFSGLVKIDSIKYADDALYKKWMKSEVERGDLLLTSEAPAGQIMLWDSDEKIVLSQRLFALRTNKSVNNQYLKYYLQSEIGQKEIIRNNSGSTVFGISAKTFSNINVYLPDYENQKLIGNLLYTLDKKIELNNQINTELEAMARTLYDYWFVQFDFPDADGKPYKTSGGKMVYNEVLKREIPEGWEVSTLANHLACNTNKLGGNHQLKALQYLDTSSLTENMIDSFQELIVGIDKVPSRANMVVSKNDILYSTVRPNLLHYGLIKQPLENMIASTGYAVLSHKTDSSLNVAFYLHITSENNTKKLVNISQSSKSSYPSISPNDILNINIALPIGLDILSNFCNISNPIFDRVSKVQSENKKLEELRDWLLPMLMNGQVTVSQ